MSDHAELSEAQDGPIVLSETAMRSLHRTATWAKWAGLSMAGLALLAVVLPALQWWHLQAMIHIHRATQRMLPLHPGNGLRGNPQTPLQTYPLFAVGVALFGVILYGIFSWLALRFSRRLAITSQDDGNTSVAQAIEAQRVFWKTQGIITLCLIALMIAVIVIQIILRLPAQA